MEINNIIAPEIFEDELYDSIVELVADPKNKINTILEIGSSSGMGSTKAILEGAKEKENIKIFCLEASIERCDRFVYNMVCQYQKCFKGFSNNINYFKINTNLLCLYNYCSINPFDYLSEKQIKYFMKNNETNLNKYDLETVLQWRREELDYIKNNKIPINGIETIKFHHNIDIFDLVLIDGSAFTGWEEGLIADSRFYILDDVNDIKNYNNYNALKYNYNCKLIQENWKLRNGYAIFHQEDVKV